MTKNVGKNQLYSQPHAKTFTSVSGCISHGECLQKERKRDKSCSFLFTSSSGNSGRLVSFHGLGVVSFSIIFLKNLPIQEGSFEFDQNFLMSKQFPRVYELLYGR